MIIAVDFDGVVSASTYPAVGVAHVGAVDALRQLHEEGHRLILWTCREGEDLLRAINWCLDSGIRWDNINCNDRDNIRKYENDTRKVYADLYVDDKQVGGFPGWAEVLRWVDCLEASGTM